MIKKPLITATVIKYLEEVYPKQMPTLTSTEREIFIQVGIAEIISHLKSVYEDQQKRKYDKSKGV